MNKELEKKRDELANDYPIHSGDMHHERNFKKGFNAAIEIKVEAVEGLVDSLKGLGQHGIDFGHGRYECPVAKAVHNAIQNYERFINE